MPIDRVVIDSSSMLSDLCGLGRLCGTDKSPYNLNGHRHPYTGVYTMLFSSLRNKPIRFCEIGVAGGASAHMWTKYFSHPESRFFFFDRDTNFLAHAEARIQDSRASFGLMDVSVDGEIDGGLAPCGEFDVILDDSSHDHGHQIRILKEAFPRLKSGGILVIEDIFRSTSEKEYEDYLAPEIAGCSAAYFVVCEHQWKWSPGWDNDKLLILVKK